MAKITSNVYAPLSGKIMSKVYSKSRLPKHVPKYDIINLSIRNNKGNIVNLFVYPQEAVLIADALLAAYTHCVHLGKENVGPRKRR